MSNSDNTPRCAGCGKTIEVGPDGKATDKGPKVARIAFGRYKEDFVEQKEWGYLHETCFNRSVDSPDAVMEEVRRQASRKVA